nr:hypothetical protein [uncultured Pantoea sp.]
MQFSCQPLRLSQHKRSVLIEMVCHEQAGPDPRLAGVIAVLLSLEKT